MSIVSNNKVVFNIKGNNYRLLVKINIEFQLTYIRFIGTHKQYDKIDVKKFNMKINPIHSKKDYQIAMKRIDEIFDSKKGSPTGNELEILSILIDNYERENFPIESPEPIEAIKFRMEQMGMDQSELAKIVGQKAGQVKS